MQRYLVFTLTASIGAMGELAGHERRGSLVWPARSAIIGLLGAACGIRRDGDFTALDALEIDIAIFNYGSPMRDYHTVESIPSAAVKAPNSRPEALRAARGKTNTSITMRDYRTDALYGVAVQGERLEALQQALREPGFVLYLGRKSCPLSMPVDPKIVETDTVEKALGFISQPEWFRASHGGNYAAAHTLVTTDPSGEVVHDVPLNRQLWHFASRRVALRSVNIVVGDET